MSESAPSERKLAGHQADMRREQRRVQARIARARRAKGVVIYLFGPGKGKSSSAFGMVCRALGHGRRCGVVQFIKGRWRTGEQRFFQSRDAVEYYCMGSGFTWDTQDWQADRQAAEQTWTRAQAMLSRPELELIVLDELAYMFAYQYLDVEKVLAALRARPARQHVIVTGRPRIPELVQYADTASEVLEIKHAFHEGIRAQKGIEW